MSKTNYLQAVISDLQRTITGRKQPQQIAALFDCLVGACEKSWRHVYAEASWRS